MQKTYLERYRFLNLQLISKLDLINEISKGDNGEIEKLHPKVQIYLEDPNKVPGGANRKFEVN